MINYCLQVCIPLFLRCKPFFESLSNETISQDFRDIVIADLVALESHAYAKNLSPDKIIHLKYAMVAFIDEMVMNSNWSHRQGWMGRTLQFQFFGEHLAGEGFFERLSEIRQNGQSYTDLLEVYFWCLQLGFQGMYRLRGQEFLLALKAGIQSQIETAREKVERISENGLPKEQISKKITREIPFWVIGVTPVGLIFLIYLFFSVSMNHQVHEVFKHLKASQFINRNNDND